MNLPQAVNKYLSNPKSMRFRDRRSFYASGLSSNMRDLYWEAIGEKPTDPTATAGLFKMRMGKWIETGLVHDILRNLHWFGIHAMGEGNDQASIGFSKPNVDGNLDAMLCERLDDAYSKPVVVEIKTTYGAGADYLMYVLEPKEENLAQLGAYLYDLSSKGVTNEGILLYVLVSDNNFGTIIQFNCRYEDGIVTAYELVKDGETKAINVSKNILSLIERLRTLEGYVERKELPPSEHVYKKPLTPEFLSAVSDNELKKAMDGVKILGDWQIRYSRYFSKHLELEGSAREYTKEEQNLLREEYRKRHPKTRKYKDDWGE